MKWQDMTKEQRLKEEEAAIQARYYRELLARLTGK